MNRIFISYRSSDGFKDGAGLAVELNRVVGKDQVFLDKEDLRGGSSWRDEIMAGLGTKPIVLALITPDYFGAVEGGSRRIDRADDPVGEELLAAFDANAQIIPLLSEGVKMPPAVSLPERLQPITSRHALRLRSEDWSNDLLRLIEDLVANKVKVQDKDWRLTFAGAPHVRAGRWMAVAVVAFLFFWASSSLSRTFPMLIVSTAKVDDGDRAMHGSLLFIGDKSASVETDAQIAPTPLTRKLLWSDLKVFQSNAQL
jgi:hypothetical protein